MIIKIAGVTFNKYNQCKVQLMYDSVASSFSFTLHFDPNNAQQRRVLKPGLFPTVTIEHNGKLLLTGTLLSYRFRSSATKQLVAITGYSKTGVLEDCQIPTDKMPLQSDKLSFTDIATKVAAIYNLTVVVDDSVKDVCAQPIPSINADATETAKNYLATIAGQLNVVVSHTAKGELLLTGYKTKVTTTTYKTPTVGPAGSIRQPTGFSIPVTKESDAPTAFSFTSGMPGIELDLIFDGQKMHSDISVQGQVSVANPNNAVAANSPLENPYVQKEFDWMGNAKLNTIGSPVIAPKKGYRPKVVSQTTGSALTTDKAQRNALSDELKGLSLTIECHGWSVSGHTLVPGDIVTVTNPDLHIYKPARFFVASAEYRGNEVKETCVLNCVVPEVFNNDIPKNIFE